MNPRDSKSDPSRLLQYLKAGVIVHAPDARILFANNEASRMLGLPVAELEGMAAHDPRLRFFHEDGTPFLPVEYPAARVRATRQPVEDLVIGGIDAPTGAKTWALANAAPELSSQGELDRIVVTLVDITRRKQAENREKHLASVLRSIRNVNQLITHERDRDALVGNACALLTESRGYRAAWIGLIDAAGRLHIAAESGVDAGFTSLSGQIDRDTWPLCCREAVDSPNTVIVHDPQVHCRECPVRPTFEGTSALAGVLRSDGRDLGVLVVSLPAEMAQDTEEQSLFSEVAGDIGFALAAIDKERERRAAVVGLAESEAQFRGTFEQAAVGIAHVSLDGQWLRVNGRLCAMLGYSRDELRSMSVRDVSRSVDHDDEPAERDRLLSGEISTTRAEKIYTRKDGSLVEIGLTVCVARGSSGEPMYFIAVVEDITERLAAQKASRESQERFRSIVEGAPDAIFIQTESRFAYVNPSACRLFGAAAADLVGTPVVDRVHAEYRATASERIRRLNEDRTAVDEPIEQKFLRMDGSDVWVETVGKPVSYEGRDGALVFVRDISHRKEAERAKAERMRAEEALRESEARFATIFNASPIGINIYGLSDNRSRVVNESFLKTFGYERDEVVGHTAAELHLFVESAEREAWMKKLREGRPVFNQDAAIRRKSGEIRHALASLDVIEIGGERMGLAIVSDITERKAAEEALRESEDRFRTLVDGAPDGIYVESDGRFLFANPAMLRLVGAGTHEELLGSEISRWIVPENRVAAEARIRLLNETGDTAPPMEFECVRIDGGRFPVETTAVAFRFQGRNANAVFVRDMTARRKADAEQSSLQAQLLQAQKMESVGLLAGGVAHDFNNILTVQRGYCEILKRGLRADDPLAKGIAQIDGCAERAAALTRQLLAFSRKQTLQPRVLDLNVLVKDLDRMLRRLIGEDVDLLSVFSPQPAMVKADPGQLEQVIVNLAVNARDAMPEGGKLTVEVSRVDLDVSYARSHMGVSPGPHIMLAMSDSGIGMDEATQRRIFEPFFTTKGEGKGTGLGLSTVYGIVRQSGGSVWVYSARGKGSTFKVYLPLVQAQPARVAAKAETTERGQGQTVLLVEDEPDLRALAEMILENLGYKPVAAANGGEALVLVEERGLKPDVILTDVIMPGMSGRVLVDRLRKTLPDAKVIYMSGYTDDAVVHHGVLESELAFLQKPFTVSALAAKLASALHGGENAP